MKSYLHIALQLLQIQAGQMPSIRRTSMMCPSMSSCERIRSPASTRRDAATRRCDAMGLDRRLLMGAGRKAFDEHI